LPSAIAGPSPGSTRRIPARRPHFLRQLRELLPAPKMAHRHVRQFVRKRGARLSGELTAFGPLDLSQELGLDRVGAGFLAGAQSLAVTPLFLGGGWGHSVKLGTVTLPASRRSERRAAQRIDGGEFGHLTYATEAFIFGLPLAAVLMGFFELMMRERAGLARPTFGRVTHPQDWPSPKDTDPGAKEWMGR
jgi:hypothetical protein